ncbi:hypothetical protein CHARACLAT_003411 [Characodon lateralis]|uniref:Uncharacterized protein n=1 Tax=Characodon lateralis TaxID=208331 RepID=A0ABU7ET90_9TELE|nr:hypothetical protein [Characodon lateralis]
MKYSLFNSRTTVSTRSHSCTRTHTRSCRLPRPAERHNPSSVSWAIPWASSRWNVPKTPPEEGVQEASDIDARATSTGSSRCGGAAALLRAPPGWPSSSPYL